MISSRLVYCFLYTILDFICRKMSAKDLNTLDDATCPKRVEALTKYRTSWETSHPWSKEVKKLYIQGILYNLQKRIVMCSWWNLKHHASSASHMNTIKTRASSVLSKFINKPNDSVFQFQNNTSSGKVKCVFHTVKHVLSFNSMDCGDTLLPTVCSDLKSAQNCLVAGQKQQLLYAS